MASHDDEMTTTRAGRRGILAVAAAAVAAIAVGQGAQPVAAATANVVYYTVGPGSLPNSVGTTVLLQPGSGFPTNAPVVQVQNSDNANITLIQAVVGLLSGPATAISGIAGSGTAVNGQSNTGIGVQGMSSSDIGVSGITTTGPYAVAGHAGQNVGVYGLSEGGPYPYGIVGQVNVAGGYALFGSASLDNAVAFGGTAYGNALAGQFIGPVRYYGQIILQQQANPPSGQVNAFIVGPGVTKNAAVEMPDGTHALMHCVEAPEPWFEDFGTGTLAGGKAEVKLDAEFLHTVDTSKMHVFCMPHDAAHHLAVTLRGAAGFSVEAHPSSVAASAGKKAGDLNGTFTYRVVAKRRDVKGDRLMRVELPKPIPTPIPPVPKGLPAPKVPDMPLARKP